MHILNRSKQEALNTVNDEDRTCTCVKISQRRNTRSEINIVFKIVIDQLLNGNNDFILINIQQAMIKLDIYGLLITIAYESRNGFKCQSEVVNVFGNIFDNI